VVSLLLQLKEEEQASVRSQTPQRKIPRPNATGLDEALELAQERYIELRTKADRGEAVNVLTIGEMVNRFLTKEQRRISSTPHEGITD